MKYHMTASLDLAKHLARQAKFSFSTFGPPRSGGPVVATQGVIDHLRKELVEVAANPIDLEEWIDIAILAFDGALRAGYGSDEIAAALQIKQRKNELRKWPDWEKATPGKAIEHIRTEEG